MGREGACGGGWGGVCVRFLEVALEGQRVGEQEVLLAEFHLRGAVARGKAGGQERPSRGLRDQASSDFKPPRTQVGLEELPSHVPPPTPPSAREEAFPPPHPPLPSQALSGSLAGCQGR